MSRTDVICPSCSGHATFEPAQAAVTDRPLREAFKDRDEFDLITEATHSGWRTCAVWYPGVHTNNLESALPDGVGAERFSTVYTKLDFYSSSDSIYNLGAVRCPSCATCRKHRLRWPDDAWYAVDVRGETLWARNAYDAETVVNFIGSIERDKTGNYGLLHNIPEHFLRAKVRDEVVKKMRAKLSLPAKPAQ